jgi:hypothetical protein
VKVSGEISEDKADSPVMRRKPRPGTDIVVTAGDGKGEPEKDEEEQ